MSIIFALELVDAFNITWDEYPGTALRGNILEFPSEINGS
jgi:hypothetical protein